MKARDVAIAAGITLAFSGLFIHPVFDRLVGLSIDVLYVLRDAAFEPRYGPNQSPTVIIAMDEETFRGKPFVDMPRTMWSKEISTVLNATYEGGAKVIGWDVVLSNSIERSIESLQDLTPEVGAYFKNFDRELRLSLFNAAKENRVVLGKIQHATDPISPYFVYERAVGRGQNVHPLNVVEDRDSVHRRVPLFFRVFDTSDPTNTKTQLIPSMSLEMAARTAGIKPAIDPETGEALFGDYRVPGRIDDGMVLQGSEGPVELHNDMAIQFARGQASIPAYSLIDLYHCAKEGKLEYFKRHFNGKAVMFGTVLDNEDRVTTSIRLSASHEPAFAPERCVLPLKSQGPIQFGRDSIAGIYMQAAAINTLLRQEALREPTRLQTFAVIVLLAGVCGLAIMAMGPIRAILVYAGLFAAWAGFATLIFHNGFILPLFQPMAACALTLAALLGYRFAVSDRQGRHIRSAFQHYLAPAMVAKLVEEGRMPEQGGEMREVSVWLSDLESYSTIAENYDPAGLVDMLNGMYSIMGDIVEKHGGFVAQYIGDAMVAVFGAPLDDPDHAKHAVDSALECQRESAKYGLTLTLPPGLRLHNRIGVASGRLLAGNVGSKRRLSYTVIGDDINLAARIEGVNKNYGSAVMVAEATKNAYGPGMVFREADIVRVKGRAKAVRIYEPIGREEDVDEESRRDLARFADGLQAYRERRFSDAKTIFVELAGRDPVAKSYIERCDELIRTPPPADWDGVNTMLTK